MLSPVAVVAMSPRLLLELAALAEAQAHALMVYRRAFREAHRRRREELNGGPEPLPEEAR
jgi:hypothetical protein